MLYSTASPFILAGIKRARVRVSSNTRSKLSSLQKVLMIVYKRKKGIRNCSDVYHISIMSLIYCARAHYMHCTLNNQYCTGGRGSFSHVQIALYKKLISQSKVEAASQEH